MTMNRGYPLSREEMELLRYYRGLSADKQFEVLDYAEANFNTLVRMAELAGREVEKGFPCEEHLGG